MKFILPLLLALIGAGAGIGAGLYLQPAAETSADAGHAEDGDHGESADASHASEPHTDDAHDTADAHSGDDSHAVTTGDSEFIKLNNQFVVPVLTEGRVKSMVVLSLSLETPTGKREVIYAQEPRIRDTFLQVLFDHANSGGFDGEFTSGDKMDLLRGELRRSGKQLLGPDVVDVLVTDIARQDFG